jgi:hypothetical protein
VRVLQGCATWGKSGARWPSVQASRLARGSTFDFAQPLSECDLPQKLARGGSRCPDPSCPTFSICFTAAAEVVAIPLQRLQELSHIW